MIILKFRFPLFIVPEDVIAVDIILLLGREILRTGVIESVPCESEVIDLQVESVTAQEGVCVPPLVWSALQGVPPPL